jgi:hypothetical protein
MAYTVTKLITNAWYLSGVVARVFETVSGDQISDGLDMLNDLLGMQSANIGLVPYYTVYNFTAVPGQEAYIIPNLLEIDSLTFNIGPVRYSMLEQNRTTYFGSGRVDNITALPFNYHLERGLNEGTIYIYFLPAGAYPMTLVGKFGLNSAALNTDLLTIYDRFYITYLRYALTEYVCGEYNINMTPSNEKKLRALENQINNSIAPLDLTLTKLSTMPGRNGINWADANIGRGWRPG